MDPVWVGHHATYFRAFIDAFLEAGARLVAFCPKPSDLDDLVRAHPDLLRVVELPDPGPSKLFRGREHDPFTTLRRWRNAGEAVRAEEENTGWQVDFVFFAWLDSYLRFMPNVKSSERLLGKPWTGLYFRNQHLSDDQTSILAKVKLRLKEVMIELARPLSSICRAH